MLCLGLLVGLGERDLGDIELGEWWGEEARGGEGMERGLLFRKPGLADSSVFRPVWPGWLVRLGGRIRGKTCCSAFEPDTLELCLRTSSWSLISCTLSWMLLKADLGRELLLFFTAEGNL